MINLDGILSDTDDETETSGKELREDQRADLLIQQVREQFACNYDEATRRILEKPTVYLKGVQVSERRVKKLDPKTQRGREKLAIDLFRQVANSCPRQQNLLDILALYHGKKYKRDRAIVHCFEYKWPVNILELYLLRILNYEIIQIKGKHNADVNAKNAALVKYYNKMFKQFLPGFFWDGVFKNEKQDHRRHVLNALYFLLDGERNKPVKDYSDCYKVDRETLLSGHGEVTHSYVTNYSNSMGKEAKPLVTIGTGSGKQVGKFKPICPFFNRKGGCSRGSNCPNKHACFGCSDGRHNILNCYKFCGQIFNNGTLNRYLKTKGMKIVNSSDNTGTRRPAVVESMSGAPNAKKQRVNGAFTQCILGHDGKYYPIQS